MVFANLSKEEINYIKDLLRQKILRLNKVTAKGIKI